MFAQPEQEHEHEHEQEQEQEQEHDRTRHSLAVASHGAGEAGEHGHVREHAVVAAFPPAVMVVAGEHTRKELLRRLDECLTEIEDGCQRSAEGASVKKVPG